jgi:hypothetical protein
LKKEMEKNSQAINNSLFGLQKNWRGMQKNED